VWPRHDAMKRNLAILAGAIAVALVGTCSPAPAKRPNIVWVVWDTVRADHMSLYGYEKKTTPFVDEWARGARVYDDCTSASSWTVPSHASMFTGLLPAEHGAQHENEFLAEDLTTIAELLKSAGYQTFAWTANPHLSDEENFLQGFDTREHPWDKDQIQRAKEILQAKLPELEEPSELERRLGRNDEAHWVLKAAGELARERWLAWNAKRDRERPFFAFFNYMEAHRPLIPPRKYREKMLAPDQIEASYKINFDWGPTWSYCFGLREYDPAELEVLRGTYDAALLELDSIFAELMHTLDEQGLADDTIVILTADHGEHLGEHHLLDHQYSLSQVLLRVPLIVRFTKKLAPGRDARPVMNMDLFPTLLELASVPNPRVGAAFGISLLDAKERRTRVADYSVPFKRPLESMHTSQPEHDIAHFERGQLALIDGDWKLVQEVGGDARLYDLAKDPGELHDAAADNVEECRRLKKNLGRTFQSLQPLGGAPGQPRQRSPELLKMLRELGYAGGDVKGADEQAPKKQGEQKPDEHKGH
jgi:arylsulfatase A-like enzyme